MEEDSLLGLSYLVRQIVNFKFVKRSFISDSDYMIGNELESLLWYGPIKKRTETYKFDPEQVN